MDPALESALPPGSDADVQASFQHVLAAAASAQSPDASMDWMPAGMKQDGHDQDPDENPQHVSMTTTTRRNANGSVSSVFSGNRIRFLKKPDGVPLWRKDIQFLFLRMVFEDENKVFTKASDGTSGHTFADIYIDAMAKSSKCSQVLKDKLLSDRTSAIHMAMICLLVNVGRMNTTLNFFPEMRARVRTYHPIPCLQAQQGSHAYKQLQDGPRLKSILKGAMEDTPQPSNIDDLRADVKPPRTNPVNLIFVLSQYAPRVSETHFFPPRDFFDLFMRPTISSRSRATAFLWLIWWYLESDFSPADASANPFGPGLPGDDSAMPVKVPHLDIISDEQADVENMDTEEEIAYGESKRQERESIVANDIPAAASGPKKGQKTPLAEQQHNYRFRYSPYGSSASDSGGSRAAPSPSPPRELKTDQPHDQPRQRRHYDGDRTRSPSPHLSMGAARSGHRGVKIGALLNDDEPSPGHPSVDHSRSQPSSARKEGSGRSKRKSRESREAREHHREIALDQFPTVTYQPFVQGHDLAPRVSSASSAPQRIQPNMPSTPFQDIQSLYNASPDTVTSPAAPAPTSNKRSKAPMTIEQSRRERTERLLYDRMQKTRSEKRHLRRRRGPILDAWIKCSELPDGYDTEEDGNGQWGGLDEITFLRNVYPNGDKEKPVPEYGPSDAGDAGQLAKSIARSFRRVGKSMYQLVTPVPAKRLRPEDSASAANAPPAPTASQIAAASTFNASETAGHGSHRALAPAMPLDSDGSSPAKPRRNAKPRPRTSKARLAAEQRDASVDVEMSTPTKKKRRSTGARRKTEETVSGDIGAKGVPIDEFMRDADADGEGGMQVEPPEEQQPAPPAQAKGRDGSMGDTEADEEMAEPEADAVPA